MSVILSNHPRNDNPLPGLLASSFRCRLVVIARLLSKTDGCVEVDWRMTPSARGFVPNSQPVKACYKIRHMVRWGVEFNAWGEVAACVSDPERTRAILDDVPSIVDSCISLQYTYVTPTGFEPVSQP